MCWYVSFHTCGLTVCTRFQCVHLYYLFFYHVYVYTIPRVSTILNCPWGSIKLHCIVLDSFSKFILIVHNYDCGLDCDYAVMINHVAIGSRKVQLIYI